jgi:hypothetical protein
MNATLQAILDHSDRREAFYMLTEFYAQTIESEREHIRAQWDFGRSWIYPHSHLLACKIPEERPCHERIRAFLIYCSIADMAVDYRDWIYYFIVVYHSAIAVGIDPVALFDSVASISSASTAESMRNFVNRTPENLDLDNFFLKRIEKSDGSVIFEDVTPHMDIQEFDSEDDQRN